jgi:hypothetical protein
MVRPYAERAGLGPVSPEGWAVQVMGVAAVICVFTLPQPWIALAAVAAMLIVTFLKGTSPGGAREREEYQAQKHRRGT